MTMGPVLGLIPARGGSKGVPRKNVRTLGDRPLVTHTIGAALAARTLDRVIVSTDDEEIAEVARAAGAEVPFVRPAAYATDEAPSIAVAHHALAWFGASGGGYRPHAVALLSPTCPFRTAAHIDRVIELFRDSDADSACAVSEARPHPYFTYTRNQAGALTLLVDVNPRPLRRQDLPPVFAHSQAVLVSRTSYLKMCGSGAPFLNFASLVGYPIDARSAFDIDTSFDFELAELLHLRQSALA
jgi:CMP-N-acetylneuraminic acid synthetase